MKNRGVVMEPTVVHLRMTALERRVRRIEEKLDMVLPHESVRGPQPETAPAAATSNQAPPEPQSKPQQDEVVELIEDKPAASAKRTVPGTVRFGARSMSFEKPVRYTPVGVRTAGS